MKRLALFFVAVAGVWACGGSRKTPDVITREGVSNRVESTVPVPQYVDPLTQGGGMVDAGCCLVPFALTSTLDEVNARIVFPGQTYPMDRDDAGVWRGTACLPPTQESFYFQVGLATDEEDGGVLFVDRVNEALPVDSSGGFAPQVNTFEGADGGTCEGIDTARYTMLPDDG